MVNSCQRSGEDATRFVSSLEGPRSRGGVREGVVGTIPSRGCPVSSFLGGRHRAGHCFLEILGQFVLGHAADCFLKVPAWFHLNLSGQGIEAHQHLPIRCTFLPRDNALVSAMLHHERFDAAFAPVPASAHGARFLGVSCSFILEEVPWPESRSYLSSYGAPALERTLSRNTHRAGTLGGALHSSYFVEAHP